jgi:hypothetical protein
MASQTSTLILNDDDGEVSVNLTTFMSSPPRFVCITFAQGNCDVKLYLRSIAEVKDVAMLLMAHVEWAESEEEKRQEQTAKAVTLIV